MNYKLELRDFSNDMNEGLIYIDSDGVILEYNEKAKELIGIKRIAKYAHSRGKIENDDIVILALTSYGSDEAKLEEEDFKKIGVNLGNIENSNGVIAIGSYNSNDKGRIETYSKNEGVFKLEGSIYDISYRVKIDYDKRFVEIRVFNENYRIYFNNYFDHCVIVDSKLKKIKFYQLGGYTAWREDLRRILSEKEFSEKKIGCNERKVLNKHILDIHDRTEIINDLIECSQNQFDGYKGKRGQINGIDALFTVKKVIRDGKIVGAILLTTDVSELRNAEVKNEMIIRKLKQAKEALKDNENLNKYFPKIIGSSNAVVEVKKLAYKASKTQSNVLILGESGTGKSVLARGIHEASQNREKPFIEVNCNSISENLMESELFGYEKGAFTGANSKGKKGYFEMANGGTIFLDEIGDFPKAMQVKLLHVIQNKRFYRVGGDKEVNVDVRIIVATNRNLEKDVRDGFFREDLYYRINVFPIKIPPLRERISDIYELINYLLPKICIRIGTEEKRISAEGIEKLKSYHWPGNIRELENVLERAVNLCDEKIILSEYIKIKINKKNIVNDEVYLKPLKETLKDIELNIIENVYTYTNRDKKETMKILKIKKTKLYEKLKLLEEK